MTYLTGHMYLSYAVQNVCLYTVVYEVSVSSHPKMPHPAKVSTNHFLDIITVKCQSPFKGEFPNSFDTDQLVCAHFPATKMKESQANPGLARHMYVSCMYLKAVVYPGFSQLERWM